MENGNWIWIGGKEPGDPKVILVGRGKFIHQGEEVDRSRLTDAQFKSFFDNGWLVRKGQPVVAPVVPKDDKQPPPEPVEENKKEKPKKSPRRKKRK